MSDILDLYDDPKWENDFRPSYDPDWGEHGYIQLNGEKEFPLGTPASEIIASLKDRCEQVGGICTHQPADNQFHVTSQYVLRYTVHYNDEDEVTAIDLEDDGEFVGRYTIEELRDYHEEVTAPIMRVLENAEWRITTDDEPQNIMELTEDDDE